MGRFYNQKVKVHQWVWVFVIFFLVISCRSGQTADKLGEETPILQEIGPTPTLPPGIFFPQTALIDGEWVRMTGEKYGTLIEENGCIRLLASHDGTNYLVIWPHHYWPDVQGGRIQILDDTGHVAAVVGQETEVHMGGGEAETIENSFYVPDQVVRAIPPECPGPYWISGGVISEQGVSRPIFVSPTFVPPTVTTPVLDPTLAQPLPGWAWYESPNGVYTIAYPQQWQAGVVVGAGVFTFSSPETNSQIRISSQSVSVGSGSDDGPVQFPDAPSATATPFPPACHDPSGTDWLDTVRVNRSSMPGLPYGTDIMFNATFSGQPAYFHFTPPPEAAGASSALLLFCNTGTIVSLYYQSATAELLPAEASIYQQMLASFVWRGQKAEPLDIPFEQLLDPSVETTEITATVSEVFTDTGIIVLERPVDGFITISLAADGRVQLENGTSIGFEEIQPGQQVRVVGEPGQAGTLLSEEIEVFR